MSQWKPIGAAVLLALALTAVNARNGEKGSTSGNGDAGPGAMKAAPAAPAPAPADPVAESEFFKRPAGQRADEIDAPNGKVYRVTRNGALVRVDDAVMVNMPLVGGMFGFGQQTEDHGWTIATSRVRADITSASLALVENGVSRTVPAIGGVKVEGRFFAVYAVKPSFHPDALMSITSKGPAGTKTLRR